MTTAVTAVKERPILVELYKNLEGSDLTAYYEFLDDHQLPDDLFAFEVWVIDFKRVEA